VKPDAFDRAQALADGHFEHRAGARAQHGGAADFSEQADGFAGLQRGDGPRIETIFVAKRQMVEQVFYGLDATLTQSCGHTLADAANKLDRRGELEWHEAEDTRVDRRFALKSAGLQHRSFNTAASTHRRISAENA
jgi:hypothetical protein